MSTKTNDLKIVHTESGARAIGVEVRRAKTGTVVSIADELMFPLYYLPEKYTRQLRKLFKATAVFAPQVMPEVSTLFRTSYGNGFVGPIPDAVADLIVPKVLAILRRAVDALEASHGA